jgi:colicin import membrane protein
MGDKVALPSLSLPKQKTHWTVSVVVVAGVLLLILGAALYAVLQRQQRAEEAFAKAAMDRADLVKAETEKAKAEAARAVAETRKKEAETAASLAAAQQKKVVQSSVGSEDDGAKKAAKKKSSHHGGSKVASKSATPAVPAQAPVSSRPPPSTKASKDIDDLLRGLK